MQPENVRNFVMYQICIEVIYLKEIPVKHIDTRGKVPPDRMLR